MNNFYKQPKHLNNTQEDNNKDWILVINPYQKKIHFANNTVIFINDFYKKNDNLVYFGCILSSKLWYNSDFVGIFGEICVVDLEKEKIIQTGMYATINKYADSLIEVAKGNNNLVFWDEKRINYLKITLNKIKQLNPLKKRKEKF